MWPSKKRWKGWTLPSKAGYIGVPVAILGILVGLLVGLYTYYNPRQGVPSATDEYIRVTNPVELDVLDVKLKNWLGDPEPDLTVSLKNPSKVPVDSVHLSLLLPDDSAVPAFRSAVFSNMDISNLQIAPGTETVLPIQPVSELENILGEGVCGASLKPLDLGMNVPATCRNYGNSISAALLRVRVSYTTIFKENKVLDQSVWIYHCKGCVPKMYSVSITPDASLAH